MAIRYVNEETLFKALCYTAPNLSVIFGPLFLGHAIVLKTGNDVKLLKYLMIYSATETKAHFK